MGENSRWKVIGDNGHPLIIQIVEWFLVLAVFGLVAVVVIRLAEALAGR